MVSKRKWHHTVFGHMELFSFFCHSIVVDHRTPLLSGPVCLAKINMSMQINIAHHMLLEVIRENQLRYYCYYFYSVVYVECGVAFLSGVKEAAGAVLMY
jgi:hypothetical protein